MRRLSSWSFMTGLVLVIIGLLGFVTVADDLRHMGEIFGVGAIFMIGVLLILGARTKSTKRRQGSYCLAGGLAIGALLGAAIDHIAVGTCGGFVMGGIVASAALWHTSSRGGGPPAKA